VPTSEGVEAAKPTSAKKAKPPTAAEEAAAPQKKDDVTVAQRAARESKEKTAFDKVKTERARIAAEKKTRSTLPLSFLVHVCVCVCVCVRRVLRSLSLA
jgi:hypothetical protein